MLTARVGEPSVGSARSVAAIGTAVAHGHQAHHACARGDVACSAPPQTDGVLVEK
ncbi:MAG: hypothetical protein ACTHNU_04120 [Gaiellales bacterium]